MILILYSVYRQLISERALGEFDELIMKSTNIDDTLVELYNQSKFKKHVYDYIESKKFITENENEIIINNKSNVFLIKITKSWIEYKDFFKNRTLGYDNILNIEDSYISNGKGILKWIIINLKEPKVSNVSKIDSSFSWKKVFIPWENWSSLPIRRKQLVYKINKFLEKNSIKLAS